MRRCLVWPQLSLRVAEHLLRVWKYQEPGLENFPMVKMTVRIMSGPGKSMSGQSFPGNCIAGQPATEGMPLRPRQQHRCPGSSAAPANRQDIPSQSECVLTLVTARCLCRGRKPEQHRIAAFHCLMIGQNSFQIRTLAETRSSAGEVLVEAIPSSDCGRD